MAVIYSQTDQFRLNFLRCLTMKGLRMRPFLKNESVTGLLTGASAFFIWGFAPLYWKVISYVPSFEIAIHRVVWSFFFLVVVIYFQGKVKLFLQLFTSFDTLKWLMVTTLLVSSNWLIFIWAVNNDQVLQASLGYYISPLMSVLFAIIFMHEQLRKYQVAALVLATIGVFYLTYQYGVFPDIAIVLALTFSLYGLMRKKLNVSAAVGLTVETFLLTVPGIIYLVWLEKMGSGALFHINFKTDVFLLGAAPMTAIPLILFHIGVKRLKLSTVGFLQFIGPSVMFLLAVLVFEEPLSIHQLIAFIFIWTALGIYSVDSAKAHSKLTQ